MNTIYLAFPNEQIAFNLAKEAGWVTEQQIFNGKGQMTGIKETLQTQTHERAIDVIGIIHKPTGNLIESNDGLTYPEMSPTTGWHWNVLSTQDLPERFNTYLVSPTNPVRGFA